MCKSWPIDFRRHLTNSVQTVCGVEFFWKPLIWQCLNYFDWITTSFALSLRCRVTGYGIQQIGQMSCKSVKERERMWHSPEIGFSVSKQWHKTTFDYRINILMIRSLEWRQFWPRVHSVCNKLRVLRAGVKLHLPGKPHKFTSGRNFGDLFSALFI